MFPVISHVSHVFYTLENLGSKEKEYSQDLVIDHPDLNLSYLICFLLIKYLKSNSSLLPLILHHHSGLLFLGIQVIAPR